ncbi:MAG: hypothetical protein GIW94_13625 [Candidatus Eremiobacteraeota bacterium]|nr:hypothetical protein [Candidatus Eremiobacteraeota bacterium]MBC5821936.1 hypothetical protein [Candidatus Eremiobacteraeota bacterium]
MNARLVVIAALAAGAYAVKSWMDFARTTPSNGKEPGSAQQHAPQAPRAGELLGAVQAAYASTLAAFDTTGGETTDYEGRDARASADAQALQRILETIRSELAPDLLQTCESLSDNIASAQLQLMAFAINRKNRGLPDSAETEAESFDRNEFKQNTEPLYNRLIAALT